MLYLFQNVTRCQQFPIRIAIQWNMREKIELSMRNATYMAGKKNGGGGKVHLEQHHFQAFFECLQRHGAMEISDEAKSNYNSTSKSKSKPKSNSNNPPGFIEGPVFL